MGTEEQREVMRPEGFAREVRGEPPHGPDLPGSRCTTIPPSQTRDAGTMVAASVRG